MTKAEQFIRARHDVAYFASLFLDEMTGKEGSLLHPHQVQLLNAMSPLVGNEPPHTAFLGSRQSGLTLVNTFKLAHAIIFGTEYHILYAGRVRQNESVHHWLCKLLTIVADHFGNALVGEFKITRTIITNTAFNNRLTFSSVSDKATRGLNVNEAIMNFEGIPDRLSEDSFLFAAVGHNVRVHLNSSGYQAYIRHIIDTKHPDFVLIESSTNFVSPEKFDEMKAMIGEDSAIKEYLMVDPKIPNAVARAFNKF